jgi:hypothetical protein
VTFKETRQLLRAVADSSDLPSVARSLELPQEELVLRLTDLERAGLVLLGDDDERPLLQRAGAQYLQREGHVTDDVLRFLPQTIDDLYARDALLRAGTSLVDEFRAALVDGRGVEHARLLIPEAFEHAVTVRFAVDLFAASVALMARLSAEEPAGSLAEEIVAVTLLEEARGVLEIDVDTGRLAPEAASAAAEELRSLFELFQDDDVLDLFRMEEPADAALALGSSRNEHLGVVDQRLSAWFSPFGWTPATGYLASPVESRRADAASA